MKVFEYKVQPMPAVAKSLADIEILLNHMGQSGWELCATEYGAFIFRREKP